MARATAYYAITDPGSHRPTGLLRRTVEGDAGSAAVRNEMFTSGRPDAPAGMPRVSRVKAWQIERTLRREAAE